MHRRWKVGSGSKIMFWTDRWVGNDTLKSRYPRLFLNSVNKEGFL